MMYNKRLIVWLALMVPLCLVADIVYGTDTTRIYFRLDIPSLDVQATHQLDSLIYEDVINQSQDLLIIGYADNLGTNTYNDTLSAKRARNVKTYLQSMGIPAGHITMCIGKGEVPRDVELPEGYAADRRVDIVPINKQGAVVRKPTLKKKKQEPVRIESKDAIKLNAFVRLDPETIEVGQLFVLDKIFFYTGRHKVIEYSMPELEKLLNILEENPRLAINIEGHVCCVPSSVDALDMDTGEIALSVNRAKYIYEYLIDKGIDGSRLSYEGFGKKRPLSVQEFTMEQQDMNKRVEIRILAK